jgi:hypothetical protein
MSETETEGMYTDPGDIVDPGVWTEDDGTGEIDPGDLVDPGVWTEDDGTGQSDASDGVDPDVWSDEDGAGAEGGLPGDLDLGDLADQLL